MRVVLIHDLPQLYSKYLLPLHNCVGSGKPSLAQLLVVFWIPKQLLSKLLEPILLSGQHGFVTPIKQ